MNPKGRCILKAGVIPHGTRIICSSFSNTENIISTRRDDIAESNAVHLPRMDMDNAGDYSHAVCRSMRIPGAWIHGIRRGMACAAGSADDGKHDDI